MLCVLSCKSDGKSVTNIYGVAIDTSTCIIEPDTFYVHIEPAMPLLFLKPLKPYDGLALLHAWFSCRNPDTIFCDTIANRDLLLECAIKVESDVLEFINKATTLDTIYTFIPRGVLVDFFGFEETNVKVPLPDTSEKRTLCIEANLICRMMQQSPLSILMFAVDQM